MLIIVAMQIFFACALYATKTNNPQFSEDNTYTDTVKIQDIYVHKVPNNSDKIWFLINDKSYYLVWHSRDHSYSDVIPQLLSKEEVTITVKNFKDAFAFESGEEIVAIRSDENVYYDIAYTNMYNEDNLSSGLFVVIAGWFFCTVFTVWGIIWKIGK